MRFFMKILLFNEGESYQVINLVIEVIQGYC